MKTTLALFVLLGLGCWCPIGLAQSDNSGAASVSASEQPLPAKVQENATSPALEQPAPAPAPASQDTLAPSDAAQPTTAPVIAVPSAETAEPAPGTNEVTAATAPAVDNRGPLTLEQELPAAIQFLARMANINIQFDPSLTFTNAPAGPDGRGTAPIVSLRWDNVTAEDALQEVLDNYGLSLMISPKTHIGRVTRKPTSVPMITAIVQLRHTSPSSNLLEVVRSTFTTPGSKITADPRTSQVVIVAGDKDIYAITNLIARLDTPNKQVLIEARLIETAKNPTSIKGIDWSGTLAAQSFSFGNGVTKGITTTETPGTPTSTTLPSGRTMSGSSGSSTATTLTTVLGNGGISADTLRGFHPGTAFLNADGVHAVLSFLNTENDTEVVATPRAVTLDTETATLSVTRSYPIFQTTPGSANVASAAQVEYTNVGTILKVTPRITANSNVALKVIPEVSNIDSKDLQVINGLRNEANVYAIRRMEANVVIPSGNTLVMGGLISDSSSKGYTKVPVLGDLPGIGMAFRRDTKTRNKVNLIIFVTPTIVQDQDYQPTPTTFLRSPIPDRPDLEESFWNSGKPYDWSKRKQ